MKKIKLKTWKQLEWGDCARCGDDAEVLSDNTIPHLFKATDKARCQGCRLEGAVNIDEDHGSFIDWNDFNL